MRCGATSQTFELAQDHKKNTGTNREASGAKRSSGYFLCHKTDLEHEVLARTAAGARMAAEEAARATPLSLPIRGVGFVDSATGKNKARTVVGRSAFI